MPATDATISESCISLDGWRLVDSGQRMIDLQTPAKLTNAALILRSLDRPRPLDADRIT